MLLVEMAGFCGMFQAVCYWFHMHFLPNPSSSHVLQGGKAEPQRGSVSCPKSHSHLGAEGHRPGVTPELPSW